MCGEIFVKRRAIQPVCDRYECKIEYALIAAEKSRAKREQAERRATREKLEELKPLQYWLKRAQTAVNTYVRARDLLAGHGCITCGTHDAEEWHAGHWISVGASSASRYDPANIHLQCRQCNFFGAGRAQEYEARLPARIGQAEVDRLKYAPRSRKWTREECQAIEAEFKKKLKELEHGQESNTLLAA